MFNINSLKHLNLTTSFVCVCEFVCVCDQYFVVIFFAGEYFMNQIGEPAYHTLVICSILKTNVFAEVSKDTFFFLLYHVYQS